MTTTLIVTEKPDAALHVAEALGGRRAPKKVFVGGVPLFEVQTENERILVCSAIGHLYAVAAKGERKRSEYPVWDFSWKPKHLTERGQGREEKWILAISKVSQEADRFINSCDFDIEGSLIGYTILKYACNGADRKAQRMKFSTLTEKELRDAYARPLPQLDLPLAFAGMCRHEVDWLYGINLSRALTQSAYNVSGLYSTLSTGRVQGPALRFVVERDLEIDTFVPVPYWIVKAKIDVDGQIVEVEYESERLETKPDAQKVVEECAERVGVIENLESRTYPLAAPTPFDLSTLQREAYRHFGYMPRFALALAERLYLDQLVSYPRTSSQKLPSSIGYEEIMKGLGQIQNYRSEVAGLMAAGRLVPNEGKREDSAHPAIYPTGTVPKRHLEPREWKIFDLVVRRFLATFGKTAGRRSDKATVKVGDHRFLLRGSRLVEKGWVTLYAPYAKFEDVMLPRLEQGQSVRIVKITAEEKYTQPPPRYNPSSLLKAMEEAEIGTKATRAEVIETLYKRGYVKEERMVATPLAVGVVEILTKYCPKVLDVTFTQELENKMEEIELAKQTPEDVVLETVDYLKAIIEELMGKEEEVGTALTLVIREMQLSSSTLSVPCPECGSTLRIVKNPRTKKRFVGCSGKWETNCTFSLPLPQLGALTLLSKRCPDCGFQLVQVKMKRRRALVSCARCYVGKRRVSQPVTQAPVSSKP